MGTLGHSLHTLLPVAFKQVSFFLCFFLLHYMHLIIQPKLRENISHIHKNKTSRRLPSRYNLVVVLTAYILTQYLQERNLCTEEPSTCSLAPTRIMNNTTDIFVLEWLLWITLNYSKQQILLDTTSLGVSNESHHWKYCNRNTSVGWTHASSPTSQRMRSQLFYLWTCYMSRRKKKMHQELKKKPSQHYAFLIFYCSVIILNSSTYYIYCRLSGLLQFINRYKTEINCFSC